MQYTIYPSYINHTIGSNIIWVLIPAVLHVYHYNKWYIPLYLLIVTIVSIIYWLDGYSYTTLHTVDILLARGVFIILLRFDRSTLLALIFILFFYLNTLNPYITTIDRAWCHILFRGMGFWFCYFRLVPYKQYDIVSVFIFLSGMYFGTIIMNMTFRYIPYITRCLLVLSSTSFSLYIHEKMMII